MPKKFKTTQNGVPPELRLYTTAEAAAILNVSLRTLQGWIREGQLPYSIASSCIVWCRSMLSITTRLDPIRVSSNKSLTGTSRTIHSTRDPSLLRRC